MSQPAPTNQSVVSAAAKEAAGDTLRAVIVPVAAIISVIVGLVVLLSGQPVVTSVGYGLLTLVAILAAFLGFFNVRLRGALHVALLSKDALLNERKDWERRVGDSEAKAADRDRIARALEEKTAEVAAAGAKAAALEGERAKLTGDLAALGKERDDLVQKLAAAEAGKAAAESAVAAYRSQLSVAQTAISTEKTSTERASLQPLIRPSIEIVPGGFLKPKVVRVVVENVGQGNAIDVQVSGGGGSGTAPLPVNGITYYPAVRPGERLNVVVGTINDFAAVEWFGVQVSYSGPFGALPNVGLRRSFR